MIHLNAWKNSREQKGVHNHHHHHHHLHHGVEGDYLLHDKKNVSPIGISTHCGLTLIFTSRGVYPCLNLVFST